MSIGPLEPHLHQAAWAAIGSIPGCAIAHASLSGPRPAATLPAPGGTIAHPASRRFSIGLSGWSPSLHRVEIEWRLEGAIGIERSPGSHERETAELLRLLEPRLAVQRRRAAEALAIHHATPLDTDGQRLDIAHLHADASLMALAIARGQHCGDIPGTALRDLLGPMIRTAHREALDYDGGPVLKSASGHVADEIGVQYAEAVFEFGPGGGVSPSVTDLPAGWSKKTAPTLTGATLLVVGPPPPDAACTAAVGRPMRDLVEVPDALAPRIIQSVETGDDWCAIRMRPLRARLAEPMRLGAFEALELLHARIGAEPPKRH